jgi:hypothetical protein
MQQRQQVVVIALVALAVVVGVLVLFAFLNRGQDSGALTGRTWQLATITGQTPAYQGVVPAEDQPRYTIAFGADGTFAARADCNTLAGAYQRAAAMASRSRPDPARWSPHDGSQGACSRTRRDGDDLGDHGRCADADDVGRRTARS